MTRKIALFFLAAIFVAVGSFAQSRPLGRPLSKKQLELLPKKEAKGLKALPQVKKFSRRASAGLISDQPEGTLVSYSRSGDANMTFLGYIFNQTFSGAIGDVVFGDNNTVYVKNVISQYPINSWVKGTINGNTISIDFPQLALELQGETYYVNYGSINTSNYTLIPAGTLTLNYDEATGDITSQDDDFVSGNKVIALVDGANQWTGYADWNLSLKKLNESVVEAPANLQTSVYSLSADGYSGSLVNVGFDGNDVYLQGFDSSLPENWAKGTISDGKLIIKNKQYLGADNEGGYHHYLLSAEGETKYDPDYEEYYTDYSLVDADITFNYDAATKSFSNGSSFLINAGKEVANPVSSFEKARIAPFKEVAATPAAPKNVTLYEGGLSYYQRGYGWGYISSDITPVDVDGNYITPDKLSYAVWIKVNGEVKQLTFSADDYIYQTAPVLTEFAYDYTDNWDITISGLQHSVYYYVIGPEAYGVQTIYRGGGEERRSEIVWADVLTYGAEVQPAAATPAYPDVDPADTGSQISFGFFTGAEDVNTVTNNAKAETYDVAIKIQDPALVGTHIESITFPLQGITGVSNASVWLTSQLRVENGKNVPDLVTKSVDLTEEGFITVTLDKPYIIPAEGVYAGYSFTIDDVLADKVNQAPVVVTDNVHEGGFYLHTSDGFLKWLDATQFYGGDALLQVTVAGKGVKDNAVSPVANDQNLYVKTNEAISLPVVFVNHGAQGIRSLDVEYSLAGNTGTQHIDLESAVDGFFGLQTSATVSLPAVAERGNYDLTLKVNKVNGVDNQEASAVSTMSLVALNTVPKHRVLLEEYTGFWCGWCPRGYASLEKLAELYPDEYVLVSYHNGDELEILSSSDFPSPVAGFPTSYIERSQELDAYYGTGSADFGIVNDLQKQSTEFANADIAINASLSASGNVVEVKTQVTFPYDVTNGQFALEYILTHDGLKDASWGQSNYYAGGSQGNPKYMDVFSKTDDSEVYGLEFNDVAVQTSVIGGIRNSIPASVKSDTPVSHSFRFNLQNAVNTSGESVIQDKSKLKAVVLLIDKSTGKVANANKVNVTVPTGIDEISEAGQQAQVSFYDLSGRKVAKPANGVFIKTVRTNGQTVSEKVLVK